MLQAKIDAGATRAITQFFFENEHYLRFLESARARGITIPIVSGHRAGREFQADRGVREKDWCEHPAMARRPFRGLDYDPATRRLIAAAVAAEQVLDLVDRGVTDFHFYTMNKADLVFAICHLLGLRAQPAAGR